MGETTIAWTGATWNPVTGCSKVSPGCQMCYAERLALGRLKGTPGYPGLPWTPGNAARNVVLHPERLEQPLRWRRPRMVFVNSMSDLFHEQIPDSFIERVFGVMMEADHHVFQALTKRPERMREFMVAAVPGHWPPGNVWLGTSIENRRFVHRADVLRDTPAAIRFISAEPLLGPLTDAECICCRAGLGHHDLCFECANNLCADCGCDEETGEGGFDPYAHYPGGRLSLRGIDWLIVGGESGPRARPMRPEWARDLRDACRASGTAFFFKQAGAVLAREWGCRDRKGEGPAEWPEDLRVREMPASEVVA